MQLPGDERRARGVVAHRVDDLVVPLHVPPEERHRRRQRVLRVEAGEAGLPVHVPARERLGAVAHVGLGVVPRAHREQLHDLTGVVLVGRGHHRRIAIEVDEHRGIDGELLEQRAEVPQRVGAQQHVLVPHHEPAADLVDARAEVRVPEPRHLLGEAHCRIRHPQHPPDGRLPALERRRRRKRWWRRREHLVERRRQTTGVQRLDLSGCRPKRGSP